MSSIGMDVNGLVAFVGGLLSFFAPCVFPLVPSFLVYVSGTCISQASDLSDKTNRKKILFHSVSFIIGFSLVFVSMGLSSSIIGNILGLYGKWIMRVGGVVLMIMGLNMLDVLKIPFLNRDKVVRLNDKPAGFAGSFLVGLTFSLGWTSCLSPVLGSILFIASTSGSPGSGAYLLGLYSLGLAIPFFVAALLVSRLMAFMQRWGHIVKYTSKALAALLILVGFFLASGYWKAISGLLD
jgi:cytochrome c-type biogenesis protein